MEMERVLAPDGTVVGDLPHLDAKELVDLYRLMLVARTVDRRMLAAQRQGRIGTYPMMEGHEAAQIGAAAAFGPRDFLYPGYRELGVQIARGMPLEVLLTYWKGLPNTDWDPHRHRMMSISVPIGSHLPQAVGHAYHTRRLGEEIVTGAFIGDGGTSENDFHSGLNFAGVWKTPTVFVCQNNSYAISVPYSKQTASDTIAEKAVAYGMPGVRVDGMDVLAVYSVTRRAVERAREGHGPTLIEAVCYRYGPHATADDARLYRPEAEEAEWRKLDPLERMARFLESAGEWSPSLAGEIGAEADTRFDEAMRRVEAIPRAPTVDIIRHAYSRVPGMMVEQLRRLDGLRKVETLPVEDRWVVGDEPVVDGPTRPMTMAEAINHALTLEMERDDSVTVLGEDVGAAGGVFRITEGLMRRFGEDRVIDTPLNESGIVGAAIGMAMAGGRPVAEIQFDGFVYPAFDQIVSHLGRIRYRTRGNASMPVVVRLPNGAGIGAHEHHCDSPEAYFLHAPGLVVVAPSNPYDAKGLLSSAIRSDDPVIFLEPKVLYRAGRREVPVADYQIPLGRAGVARPGTDVTVVTYGATTPQCVEAADRLAGEGVSVEVIDLRTLYPWDFETVTASVEKTQRLLVVQQTKRSGGVAGEIAAEIGERCGWSLAAPIRRLAATDAPWPQFAIESHALLTTEMIQEEIRDLASA